MTEVELLPECQDCKSTKDLAQCPECHLWFCGAHDPHYCIPQLTTDLQERIALFNRRADRGEDIILPSILSGGALFLLGMTFIGEAPDSITEQLGIVSPETYLTAVAILAIIAVALAVLGSVLGYVISQYYGYKLRKYRAYFRSIRPETAKKDR